MTLSVSYVSIWSALGALHNASTPFPHNSEKSAASRLVPLMATSSVDAKLASLVKANRVLTEQLSRDTAKVPDPGDVILGGGLMLFEKDCTIAFPDLHFLPASSSSSYTQAPNHAWTPFELRRTMMIPEELFLDFERK